MSTLPEALHSLAPSAIAGARRSLERVVRELVPSRADFCLVHLATRGGIKAVAGAHASRDGDRILRMLMRTYRIAISDGASGVASVMRNQRPLLRTAIQIDTAVARRGDAHAVALHRQLAPRSALVVPILTPVGVIGGLTFCYSESGRTYTARHVAAAERIAAAIAQILALATGRPSAAAPATRMARQAAATRRRLVARH